MSNVLKQQGKKIVPPPERIESIKKMRIPSPIRRKMGAEGKDKAGLLMRIQQTKMKPVKQRSIAELLELASLSEADQQFSLAVEIENKIRDHVSILISRCYDKTEKNGQNVTKCYQHCESVEK